MSAQTKRILLWIALIATTPCLLFTALWCVVLFGSVNPMVRAFITDFEVENRTQEAVWVTPVGTYNSGGKKVLPQFSASFMPFLTIFAWESRDLHIGAGERRRIYYDCDDINFSEIVVRDSTETVTVLVVDANPPTDDYYANQFDVYFIDDIGNLPQPTPSVSAAIAPIGDRTMIWCCAFAGLVALFLFRRLRRELRRSSQTSETMILQVGQH